MITTRSKIIIASRDETLVREMRRILVDVEVIVFVNGARVAAAVKLHPTVSAVVVENTPSLAPLDALEAARGASPAVRRVLVSEHCDLQLVTEGLHRGVFHKLIYRPLDEHELFDALEMRRPAPRPVTVVYPTRPAAASFAR